MPITKKDAEKLRRAVRILVRAEIADAQKGGSYPEDMPIIEEELRTARIRLSVLLAQLVDDVTGETPK